MYQIVLLVLALIAVASAQFLNYGGLYGAGYYGGYGGYGYGGYASPYAYSGLSYPFYGR